MILQLFCSALTLFLVVAQKAPYLTGPTGVHIGSNQFSQTVGKNGPILLQDIRALEKLRSFNKERIPERVVHARGAGAHGKFVSNDNWSKLTASHIFSGNGVETEIFVRFSTVIHGKHSPETLRDPRGFAIKFKDEVDGNWDLVGNNLPVFFIRDHIKFPDVIHSLKPDPVTNLQDPNRFFDLFAALGGTATNMLTYLYSDLGIPKAYRFMNGSSVHAYKMINATGHVTYVKFRMSTHQGVQNLTRDKATKIQGMDFNHATRDLYDAIANGDYPKWDLAVQTMQVEELDSFEFNPLDDTKIWPEENRPFVTIGTFELNRIPDNFFLFTEQSAFCPGNFISGMIEPSEDRMLQGRLISYHETQAHRHQSSNFVNLPVNRPKAPVHNYNQEGVMAYEHYWNGSINYQPSMNPANYQEDKRYLYSQVYACGKYVQKEIEKTQDFMQAGELYRSFSATDQTNLVGNIASDLGQVRSMIVKNTMCSHFYKADNDYGMRVADAVGCKMETAKMKAMKLED